MGESPGFARHVCIGFKDAADHARSALESIASRALRPPSTTLSQGTLQTVVHLGCPPGLRVEFNPHLTTTGQRHYCTPTSHEDVCLYYEKGETRPQPHPLTWYKHRSTGLNQARLGWMVFMSQAHTCIDGNKHGRSALHTESLVSAAQSLKIISITSEMFHAHVIGLWLLCLELMNMQVIVEYTPHGQ